MEPLPQSVYLFRELSRGCIAWNRADRVASNSAEKTSLIAYLFFFIQRSVFFLLEYREIHLSYRWIRCEVMRLLLKTIIETWLREKCRRWDEILTSEGLVSAVLRIVPLTRWPECAGWLEWLVVDWELSGSPDEILWWWRKPPASWTCCCWLWWATAATAMCLSSIVEPMALLLPPRDPDPLTPPTLPPLLMPPMPPPTPLVLLLFLCFLYFTLRMKRTGMG